jgi:hypothetical protein
MKRFKPLACFLALAVAGSTLVFAQHHHHNNHRVWVPAHMTRHHHMIPGHWVTR